MVSGVYTDEVLVWGVCHGILLSITSSGWMEWNGNMNWNAYCVVLSVLL